MKAQALTLAEHSGLVVSITGRHILVQDQGPIQGKNAEPAATVVPLLGPLVLCHPRGKKSEALVGDTVRWTHTGDGGVIEAVDPRKNVFFRQDAMRIKRFAANIDQIVFCIAAEPVFSEWQLARALIAAKAQEVPLVIILNKSDLRQAFAQAWQRLAPYRSMGYQVLPLTLQPAVLASKAGSENNYAKRPEQDLMQGLKSVQRVLYGKSSLILGPSGVGKSSLINGLIPDLSITTQAISKALGSGKHTTTATTWHWALALGEGAALIDSPGFQEFGLYHLNQQDLAQLMPDLAEHLGDCRFHNCQHMDEPDCGVRAAVASVDGQAQSKAIAPTRYKIYQTVHQELQQKKMY